MALVKILEILLCGPVQGQQQRWSLQYLPLLRTELLSACVVKKSGREFSSREKSCLCLVHFQRRSFRLHDTRLRGCYEIIKVRKLHSARKTHDAQPLTQTETRRWAAAGNLEQHGLTLSLRQMHALLL